MPLTDAKIKGLRPQTARYMESDGNGLSMDVLQSGKKSWIFRYWLNGKQERVTLGQYPAMSLKMARDKRDELATETAKGKSPATEKRWRAWG
jgi:hypothetical protein